MKTAKYALASLLLALLWTTPSFADSVTYNYQGPQLTEFFGTYACSAGVGECSITISLTLTQALADNFNGSVTPTAFTISDGTNTLTQASDVLSAFEFQTNSTGAITGWFVEVDTRDVANSGLGFPVAGIRLGSSNLTPFGCGTIGTSSETTCAVGQSGLVDAGAGTPFGDVGSWTVAPEPSTLALLLTSLLALVAISRHRNFC